MGAVTVAEMLAAEQAAFASGRSEEEILELAGASLGHSIGRFFKRPGLAVGYLGKGHNAGDTLVALAVLRDHYGWRIAVRAAFPMDRCAPLVAKMFSRHGPFQPFESEPRSDRAHGMLLLIDGLLGSGARGSLRDPLLPLAAEMNRLRDSTGARIASVDVPSGVDPDLGTISSGSVRADATFMIGNAKRGLLRSTSVPNVGALVLVDVPPLSREGSDPWNLVTPSKLGIGIPPRPFEFHKGQAGRVGIIAGSTRYSGAAALAALGALRSGAGLVTVHTPADAVPAVTMRCPPEVMVRGFINPAECLEFPSDALVIGCGLGFPLEARIAEGVLDCIRNAGVPTVIDADALNLLAERDALALLTERHVLTPHPGEFRRLAPDLSELPREQMVAEFIGRHPSTLLLKGARTLIGKPGAPLWSIGTGTPAMATGGQGDLLSGVIASWLAREPGSDHCAALASWLCGRAAELAVWEGDECEESVTPSMVAAKLGRALRDWRESAR